MDGSTEAEVLAFRVIPCGRLLSVDPLERGEVSISRSGVTLFYAEDLAAVGIDGPYCIVVGDPDTFRVAVRARRSGEEESSVTISTVTRKGKTDSGRRRITLTRAIRECGVTCEAVAARYNLYRHDKDNEGLLIICLTDGPAGGKKQTGK